MATLCAIAVLLSCDKDDITKEPDADPGIPQVVANFTFESGTEGVVTFKNTSENATSYAWDFGDGNKSIRANPIHTFAKDSTYMVRLTATNAGGSDNKTATLIITPKGKSIQVIANFTFRLGAEGAVIFNNTSKNATDYVWDFGDGSKSTEENPTHMYAKDSTYTVKFTATNAGESADTTAIISLDKLSSQLIADFTFKLGTEGAVIFTNTSKNATDYAWDFGDGNKSNAQDTTHIFVENKDYAVKLTATDSAGESADTTKIITITNALPIVAFKFKLIEDPQKLGVTVIFENTSENVTRLEWDFGDGNKSTDENPTHIYTQNGDFDVTLTATNRGGSADTTQTVTIKQKGAGIQVIADFSFTQASGRDIIFTNTSKNATSYTWDFGDGNTSTDASPTHTYTFKGNFDVTLTATNSAGISANTTQTVTIVFLPTSRFRFIQSPGGVVAFQNRSSNASSFEWDFGDGNTSTDPIPTHTYTQNGVFDVTFIAKNSAGESASSTQTVTIVLAPVSDFSFSIASGGVVTFTNTSTNAAGYTWDFGDGNTSTATSPTHTYTQSGDFDVKLTARNSAGGSDVSTQKVAIVLAPVSDFSFSIASGGVVTFTNTSLNATGYTWDFGDGSATSTATSPTHTFTQNGAYDVTLTAGNSAGASVNSTQTVTIVLAPVSDFSFSIASGGVVTFTNTSTNATGYTWDFGDGNTSTATSPTHTYTQSGAYDVTLTATNGAGVSVNSMQRVAIVLAPVSDFSFSIASGGVVTFTNTSTNATGYTWDFGDGSATSTAANPTHTYTQNGAYDVTLTARNSAGGSDVSTQKVAIVLAPVSDFSFSIASGGVVTFTNTSTNATGYTWDFGDGSATSTDASPTHTYTQNGAYDVTLTARNSTGASVNSTQTVTIVLAPVSDFTFSIASGGVVTFTNTSTNATGYTWDFGDGSATSTATSPTHTFTQNGAYDVTLTARNGVGALANTTQTVTISNAFITIDIADLSQLSVIENSVDGTVIVEIAATVTNSNDTPVYSILSQNPAGAIGIVGNKIVIADSSAFDYETNTEIIGEIQGTVGGVTATAMFMISITDVDEEINIPDANFKAALLRINGIDANRDQRISVAEAQAFKGQIYIDNQGITDATGIEYFTNIVSLGLGLNALTAIDVSQNTALRTLVLDVNQLTTLDISQNTALTFLNLSDNNLTALDVSNNTALTRFNVRNNNLTALDVSKLTALRDLGLSSNELTKVNLANGNNNAIINLNLTFNPNLTCIKVDQIPVPSSGWMKDAGANYQTTDCN